MIRLALPVHPTEGYSVDLSCPVVVCDVCSELVDSAHPGLLAWSDTTAPLHVHNGRCLLVAEAHRGHLLTRGIRPWLEQLANNYAHPVIGAELEVAGGKVTVAEVRLTTVGEPPRMAKSREARVTEATFAFAQARLGREPDPWDWCDVTDKDRRRAELLVESHDAELLPGV